MTTSDPNLNQIVVSYFTIKEAFTGSGVLHYFAAPDEFFLF
ncbi:hypothetical protein D1BOALGB6SA_7255 [Olavius sp. associated proteobacterium Delta 1]|nr:hypothetical protein D1BOALGB6SA_7255 [Olavius sp. associated proteobacterium Delta 1]